MLFVSWLIASSNFEEQILTICQFGWNFIQFGIMAMELLNKKRLLLRNSHKATTLVEPKNISSQEYEETILIVNEMVGNVRMLLHKTKTIREELQQILDQQALAIIQPKLVEYRKFQRSFQNLTLSETHFNQSMAGAFVMRLCREINYFVGYLPFVSQTIEQIDHLFCQQKNSGQLNIELIYFFIIKQIAKKSNQNIKIAYQNVVAQISSKNLDEDDKESTSDAVYDPFSLLYVQKKKNQQKVKSMNEFMNDLIIKNYKGLDVAIMEPIRLFQPERDEDSNIDFLLKKQLRRSKRLKKQIDQFFLDYQKYAKKKKTRVASQKKFTKAKNKTNSSELLKKFQLCTNDSVTQQRNRVFKFPVLVVSKTSNKSRTISQIKTRSKSREKKLLSISKSKTKLKLLQKKENIRLKQQKLRL